MGPRSTLLIATAFAGAWFGGAAVRVVDAADPAEFLPTPWFGERTYTAEAAPNVRIHVNVPADDSRHVRTRLMIYALPNGNTIEQTLGCKMSAELDFRYDIQHVAAQLRLLRSLDPTERLVLVCAEAKQLSWPAWRQTHDDPNTRIAALAAEWRRRFGRGDCRVTLTGHSGGGSFMFGVVEGSERIPDWIDRIAFLDANYAFDQKLHAGKLRDWLAGDASRRLVVVAYDDREIVANGKKVVGPDGGTFRATQRTLAALREFFAIAETPRPPFVDYDALDGRVRMVVHQNPNNEILHTALVGEMNALVHAETAGTPRERPLAGPRAYTEWVQPAPTETIVAPQSPRDEGDSRRGGATLLPPRPPGAIGGAAFIAKVANLSLDARENLAYAEITSGNFPEFLRCFYRVRIAPQPPDSSSAAIDVMCDYLAVGGGDDFVRMPLTPRTAQRIADRFGCTLPTRRMVDAIDRSATVRLEPQPLVEHREAAATFLEHQRLIERQRGRETPAGLLTGIKKDLVLSPEIFTRPKRLALYGWRKPDGEPIQPLTTVHWNRYVDYSHAARLVRDACQVDGAAASVAEILRDPERCALLSDEGPIDPPRYPEE